LGVKGAGLTRELQRLERGKHIKIFLIGDDYDYYDISRRRATTMTTTRAYRYLFFFGILLKEKNLLIPAEAESSPSMQPFEFWTRTGAFGARAILELCAKLVWCELYDIKDDKKNLKKTKGCLLAC